MSVQIERRRSERRQAEPNSEDLSPEYLALLEVCGGEIRASDRAVLAERREAMQAEAQAASAGVKKETSALTALPSADRRGAGTT